MSSQLVPGSLRDVANGSKKSLAQVFTNIDALVLIDISGSMDLHDAPNGNTRWGAAVEQLTRLQREMPGRVGVIAWHSFPAFCPGGLPGEPDGDTNLTAALQFAKPADGLGIKLIVISDGEPNDEASALDLARQFKTHLDTIYVGPENGPGRDFLRRLASASGGQFSNNTTAGLAQLAPTIQRLIAA